MNTTVFVFIFVTMKKIIFTISTLICAGYSFAQSATKTHVVTKGETITQIAKKYNTTNNILFILNPDAVEGVSENQILKIPTTSNIQHEVQAKETVYGISKKYNIATEKLFDLNPGLKENGLKIGQKLNLVDNSKNTRLVNNTTSSKKEIGVTTVLVEKGETIYGLAVNNNTTVSKLYELNPGLLDNGLKVGQPINIPVSEGLKSSENVIIKDSLPVVKPTSVAKTIVVQPKETIYNIAKSNGISKEQLLQWNPSLKDGLKVGANLIIGYTNKYEKVALPSAVITEKVIASNQDIDKSVNLSMVKDGSTKDLVMLLPFNISKNNFQNPSINQNIKNDVFLNMTLDFYAGSKLAIDQLKSKNYNLNIKFVDSKETNRALDVNALKTDFDFTSADVIIGPFFQKNVDAVSEAFKNQQTIVISPLSTDKGKPYPRQVHTMPNSEIIKKEMLEYVLSKQERVIAITDGKNTSEAYFSSNYPAINVMKVETNEKISQTNLKNLFAKEVTNYIVYDASSLTTTVELIAALKSLQKDYKIQLVSLEKLDILESSDIEINDLVTLKYTFPSVTNDVDSNKKEKFIKTFKEIYDKTPSRFATRGYDVTYDVITRMFEAGEDANIFDYGSQQIENKFTYINENGGVYNNAVFILYYDKDLTIKEAK